MKSVTKSQLTEERIREIFHKHFPEERVTAIVELTEGMYNSAFLVEGSGVLQDGVVLKVGPDVNADVLTYEKDIMRTEVDVYKRLKDLSIPVPRVLACDFSKELVDNDYFIMTRVYGNLWKKVSSKLGANRQGLLRQLGRFTAVIHSVRGDCFGYDKTPFSTWGEAFSAMTEAILGDGEVRGDRLPYDAVRDTVKRCKPLLDEITAPCLVDFDLWAGNVFVSDDRAQVTGIIDFERSFYGDPYADFTSSIMLYSDVDKETDFRVGYAEASGRQLVVTDRDRTRMELYRLYMSLILFVETYRYGKLYQTVVRGYCRQRINKLLKKINSQLLLLAK